jgi:hypothetical protein
MKITMRPKSAVIPSQKKAVISGTLLVEESIRAKRNTTQKNRTAKTCFRNITSGNTIMKEPHAKKNAIPTRHPTAKILTAAALSFILNIAACTLFCPLSSSDWSFEAVYVDSVTAPDSSTVNVPFSIRIKGNLPDPSWKFDHFELFTEQSTLSITPIGKQNLRAGAVPQVLISYEEEISYTPTQIGSLTIKVVGRAETLSREVTVTERT